MICVIVVMTSFMTGTVAQNLPQPQRQIPVPQPLPQYFQEPYQIPGYDQRQMVPQQQQQQQIPVPATNNQIPQPVMVPLQSINTVMNDPATLPLAPRPRTIYEEAVQYWSDNRCEYPPQDFYPMFQYTCNVPLDNIEFSPGLCYAFFNSTKQICHMNLEEEERKTLTSISLLQETVENDDICDTISSLRQDDPGLFPRPTGLNSWFGRAYDILFSDRCKYACGLRGAHPICFGFFLSYELLSERTSPSQNGNQKETAADYRAEEQSQVSAEADEIASGNNKSAEETFEDIGLAKMNQTKSIPIFRPNPKLLLGQKFAGPDDYYYYDETLDDPNAAGVEYLPPLLSEEEEIPKNENVENGLIDADAAGGAGVDVKVGDDNKAAYDSVREREEVFEDLNVLDLLPEKIGTQNTDLQVPEKFEDVYFAELDGKGLGDLSDEEVDSIYKQQYGATDESWMRLSPLSGSTTDQLMMNFVLLAFGLMIIILMYILFRASRRGYIRRRVLGTRPAGIGGRNWNYERVQQQQADDDDDE